MSETPKLRLVKSAKCPICRRPAVAEFKPFCSRRCADIDLGRWLKEGYRIPSEEAVSGEDMGNQPSGDEETGRR